MLVIIMKFLVLFREVEEFVTLSKDMWLSSLE